MRSKPVQALVLSSLFAATLSLASRADASASSHGAVQTSAWEQASAKGLAAAEVRTWIASIGGQAGPVQTRGDQTYFTVSNAGMNWTVFFYGCQEGVCDTLQFSAVVTAEGATMEAVNGWNRDNRFLKAFHSVAQSDAGPLQTGMVQYDVVALAGRDAEQLSDPLTVWLQLLPQFARAMGYDPGAPAMAPGR